MTDFEALPPAVRALRTAAVVARTGRTTVLALRGDGARTAAQWLLPSRVQLRDAHARQSLLLREDGFPVADVTVAADDEDYLLFVDGLPHDAALAHVGNHLPTGASVRLEDCMQTHDVVSVHGPWAWELVAEVLGADLVALPYLGFFRIDHGWCLRAGRTGEYGYEIVVAREEADRVHARLREAGAAFGAVETDERTLSVGGFENWFFDPAHVPDGATPVELQLQWRLASDRDFLGRAAVDARRTAGPAWRLACVLADGPAARGDRVRLGDLVLGEVFRAERSDVLGRTLVSAKLDAGIAHAALSGLVIDHAGKETGARTVAPPLLDNRSLYVDPRRHTHRAQEEIAFGPIDRVLESERA